MWSVPHSAVRAVVPQPVQQVRPQMQTSHIRAPASLKRGYRFEQPVIQTGRTKANASVLAARKRVRVKRGPCPPPRGPSKNLPRGGTPLEAKKDLTLS